MIALVQKAGNHTDTGSGASVTVNPTGSGNLIVVLVSSYNNITVTGISDDAPVPNQYIQVPSARALDSSGRHWTDIWYAYNSQPNARTITSHLSGISPSDIFVFEISGIDKVSPLQEVGIMNDGASTSTPVGSSVKTINPMDFIASVISPGSDVTGIHSGNEFTLGNIAYGNASAYLIANTAGVHAPQFDLTVAATFCSSTVAFKGAQTQGNIVTLKATANPGGTGYTISKYEWTVDGAIAANNTDTLTASLSPGNHTVTLRVQNSCGSWSASYSQNIQIGGPMPQQTVQINVNAPIISTTVTMNLVATVKVTVLDPNSKPIQGATCAIGTISAVTDATGLATLSNIPYGMQTLTVTAP